MVSAGAPARQDLEVKCLWHQQVHQSKVAVLSFSADDGTTLWSGCDALAPRPGPDLEAQEPPVLEVSCKDGSTDGLHRASGLQPCNVRLVQPLLGQPALLCVTGDGGMVTLALDVGSKAAAACSVTALPGTPAAAALHAAAAGGAPAEGQVPQEVAMNGAAQTPVVCAQALSPQTPAAAGAAAGGQVLDAGASGGMNGSSPPAESSAGPEFSPAPGYRGHREGYLFREGSLGAGYYRKGVVRLYCPTVLPGSSSPAALPPAAPATESVAATPASGLLADDSCGSMETQTAANGGAAANGAAGQPSQQPLQQLSAQHGVPPQHAQQALQAAQRRSESHELPPDEARRYIARLLSVPPSMHSVLLSPCGVLLFTSSLGTKDCSIRVWGLLPASSSANSSTKDTAEVAAVQPELHRTLTGHTAPVLSLALTPDGRLLLSGSYDQTIRVWSTADWHCLRVLKGHGGGVRSLAVAPDGCTLYSAAADNTIRAWSMQHWVCLRTMHGRHDDTTWPACLALSPDGSLLASGSTGPFGASTIKVFSTGSACGHEAGTCLASFAQLRFDQRGGMSALLFSPDGRTLYSGASDGTLAKWQLSWQAAAPAGKAPGLKRGFL